MKIAIINGPNLNLLGNRETNIYGTQSFETYFETLQAIFKDDELIYFQDNVEGNLVTAIQQFGFNADAIVLNPAAYTHTSVAIGDAVAAVTATVVEVHISNIFARESFRQISHVSAKCAGVISGLGLKGYELAIHYIKSQAVPA
ncbi:type II 3-dehydroquinate dehydratase [Ferruginibacter yonginensis]|uniref:3-dehydroquinate dehydratase n=1 Tax=Ferruginibacter yonginensis TaxID=1310416 RepID=A0ABV8QVR4_9BACT